MIITMKKYLTLLAACLFAAGAPGCSRTANKLEKIQEKGELVVYIDPNFAPFEFSGTDGIQGVDIEIAKAIAEDLGVSVSFREVSFDLILTAVKDGTADISVSGFTITEDRMKSVDFSIPYIGSVQYMILPEDSGVGTIESLENKKIGVAKDYTAQFLLEDETGEGGVLSGKNAEIREYSSCAEAVIDLNAGHIDVIVIDEHVAKNAVSKNEGLEAKALEYQNGDLAYEEYGVVIPKGNEDLVHRINEVIKSLIGEDKIREWVIQFSE
jgi:polar amino acid transport system substrate-binding protein